MSELVVIDADVLGRHRTGDETYVENLLRRLPARLQELRMLLGVPRALRRFRPALAHFQHSVPPRWRGSMVVTVHDLSFERTATAMGRRDRAIFKVVVPWSVRRARQVIAVSERTKRDLIDLYHVPEERITVTPHGIDPAFGPSRSAAEGVGEDGAHDYLLFVGAIQERKNPLAALAAAEAVGLPLVVAGPEREPALARELERRGADLRGYVEKAELAALYRGAAVLVLPSRYEGFGLPVLEAMACGTPVVANPDAALKEVAGDAALYAEPADLAAAIRRAIAERGRLVAAGFARATGFSWDETARLTLDAYRKALA